MDDTKVLIDQLNSRISELQRSQEARRIEQAAVDKDLQGEVEERAAAFRSQQDELGRIRTALAVKRQEAKSLRQRLATHHAQAQDLKEQVEQRVARIKEAEQQRKVLLEAVSLQRVELEQSQVRVRKLAEELRMVEGGASEIDQQTMALEQQTLEMRHTMTELESVYRRCLLESQK